MSITEKVIVVLKVLEEFMGGGKSKGTRPEGLTDEILKLGMEIESEHSSNPDIQRKIVYDHVAELGPDYYRNLKAMEDIMKAQKK